MQHQHQHHHRSSNHDDEDHNNDTRMNHHSFGSDKNVVQFMQVMYEIVESMHSPCMRLELLQYILGLDNRYSVALIKESMELAATCISFLFVESSTQSKTS